MPKVSEFFGIVIYGDEEALIAIRDLSVLRGRLPPRAMGLVVEWATLWRSNFEMVWRQAENLETRSRVEPLK